jgi:hypothetical protein
MHPNGAWQLGQQGALVQLAMNGNQLTGQQPFHSYMQEHRAPSTELGLM